jgi:hypothetical protein
MDGSETTEAEARLPSAHYGTAEAVSYPKPSIRRLSIVSMRELAMAC